jgi:triosephosphate isomerase
VQHYDEFVALVQQRHNTIVLCPELSALYPLSTIFRDSGIYLGAQDCSNHIKGPFTGQISVESLKSMDINFCIVGHSERRKFNGEINEAVGQKTELLLDQYITPIICIGESLDEYQQNKVFATLENQLTPILMVLKQRQNINENTTVCIAYEPIWSIGTGDIPPYEHLEVIFSWLYNYTKKHHAVISWKFLYGGSIHPDNIQLFNRVSLIDGFLIGNTSLDFQAFKKIVECCNMK